MAYSRNRSTFPSKVDPCVGLCNTFNSLCFKKASKNCFYEDYVLLRNQLLLLEYDEDDDDFTVPSKLCETTDMLRRYIDDVPKPIQETIEFVKDVNKQIFFLHGIAARDVRVSRKFTNSQELHLLLVRYVELEYEVLYSPQNYSPEYQKQVEERVLSSLLTIFQDSEGWEWDHRAMLEGNTEEKCAMNTLYIMTRIRVEYKKQHNFIENIMIKLLRMLNVLDKVSEMKNNNSTFQVDKLLQVPKVQKIFEYLQNRDYGLEDPNSSDDEIEVAEVATPPMSPVSPVKDEVADEVEEKFDVSLFACQDGQKKIMTIDLIDEDFSMVYFRPEVQKIDRKDKKSVFDDYNVQISERTLSNISDRFDKYIQLNSVTTSTFCDNKPLISRSAISNDSVFVIEDDSDSDIEIIHDRSAVIVNLENDSIVSSEPIDDIQQQSPHLEKSKHDEVGQDLQSDTNSSELEDALLHCDDISDNEIENEDEILNKYDDDDADYAVGVVNDVQSTDADQTRLPVSTVISDKTEDTISIKKSTINNEKTYDQDNRHKDETTCANSDHLNLNENEFQNNDSVIREIGNDRLSCNSENEINPICCVEIPTVSHTSTSDEKIIVENEKDDNFNTTVNVPASPSNLNEINTLNENSVTPITATNNQILPKANDSVADSHANDRVADSHANDSVADSHANEVTEESVTDFSPVNRSTEINAQILKEDYFDTHVTEKSSINSLAEAQAFESSAQTVSVTTANSSFTVATEESFINSTTNNKINSNIVGQHQLSALSSGYNSTDAIANDIALLNSTSEDYVQDATEVVEQKSIAEVHEDNQVSVKHETSNKDDVVADNKVLDDINSNSQSEITDTVQNQIEEIDELCIANEQELEASNEYLLPSEDNKSDQEQQQPEMVKNNFNIQEEETIVNVEDKQTSKNESLQCPNTKNDLNSETTKTTVIVKSECITSPKVDYENQTSCEDIEKYAGEFNHTCSNNLVFFASVVAEQEKMETFIEMKQRRNQKKGRKVIKSNKTVEKSKKKTRKSELAEAKNNKEIGVVTRRVTRSSSAQLNYTKETQDHPKCIPSAFMNLENLVTPTPNRIYNLISETVIENEESLDEPYTCICENQQNTVDGHFPEIVAKNPVFDEDTIEDGITLVCHKKQQSNNDEVVISIPDSEKDYPGINYDILEQAEQFAETNNAVSNNCVINENTPDGLNCKVLSSNISDLSEAFYQSSQINTQSDVLPKDTNVCKNKIWQEVIAESTKNNEFTVECHTEDIVENENVVNFEGKEITVSDPIVPIPVSESDSLLPHSAPIENCELEVDSPAAVVKTDTEIVPAMLSEISHEIIINKTEDTIPATDDTESFNHLQPTVREVKTHNTPVEKIGYSETTNFSPKKHKRKASLNKTTLLMPVKKRQNYGKKNIIINKYEEKNVEIDEIQNREIEAVVVVKNTDAGTFQQQKEAVIDKTLDISKQDHLVQTKDVSVLDDFSSIEAQDSSIITNENLTNNAEEAVSCITSNVLKEAVADKVESKIPVCSNTDADSNKNHIIEENCEITIPENEISISKMAANNKLQSKENDQDLQNLNISEPEIQQEVVNNSAQVELTEKEINSSDAKLATLDCVTEASEFAVDEEINSSKSKPATVNCVTETPEPAIEEEINSCSAISATLDSVTEAPEFTDEVKNNSPKTKLAIVDCVIEAPEPTAEEEINSCSDISAIVDSVPETPEFAVEEEVNSYEVKSANCVVEAPKEGINSCNTISATMDSLAEAPEFTVEEEVNSCKAKSATLDCVMEAPEFTVEEEVNSCEAKSAILDCVTEAPEFVVEEEINASKTNSATVDCVMEAPESTVEEEEINSGNTTSAIVNSVTETSEFSDAEEINSSKTKSATVDSVMETPELTVEEEINSGNTISAILDSVTETPEFTDEEEINSSKTKSATVDSVMETPECDEVEINLSKTKPATVVCITEAPELTETIVPLVKSVIDTETDQSVQSNNSIEPQQLQQSIDTDCVINKDEQTINDFCESEIINKSKEEIQTCGSNEAEENIEVPSPQILSEEEIQTCETNQVEKDTEVPSTQILTEEESIHETVVLTENETSENVIECTAEVLVDSVKICNEDNVPQTPPVLEKVIESYEISDGDNGKEISGQDSEFEDIQDMRTMPTLEREISLNQISKPIEDANSQKEDFLDDSYPLLSAYEIEAVTEEVVESCISDTESQKLLQLQVSEENIHLETSENLVEIPKQIEVSTHEEVVENSTDSFINEQTKFTANKTEEPDSKNVKIVTNNNNSKTTGNDRNRRVLTKAALKSFQNPYVQLQKLPDNYDYKRKSSELGENPKVAQIGEQRSKSQDTTSKRRKRDSRSLSETKHKKKHETLENSELPKREKRVRQKERESHSKKSNNIDYFPERDENQSRDSKEDAFKTKTRSSSQRQRDKEAKPEKTKSLRSVSESKIELKSEQNEIASEKKSTQNKDKQKISKSLQLFSVEDSKITYYDKKKKQEKETAKRDGSVYIEKGCDRTVDPKSIRKEEKSSQSIADMNEEVANYKPSPVRDSSSRSSSRNDKKTSKHARDKTKKEEIETRNKRGVSVTKDDNNSTNESNYSTRRHSRSRRSISISKSTDNTKNDKTKETGMDLNNSIEKSKENENSEKIANFSDSNKIKDDFLPYQVTSDKNSEVLADVKKLSDRKRRRSSRSSSKNSDIIKSENKDSEDTVYEKKKPRIEKNKENVCSPKSESDFMKKNSLKKSSSADIVEKNTNDLESKVVIDMENVEPKVSKRERRESLRSSSSREKAKIKSSLKENGLLSETDLTVSKTETCPLDLSEKPRAKLLKENKKISKKRRIAEDHRCELEATNFKNSTNKILILEDKKFETTDPKPPVNCMSLTMTKEVKIGNRDTITNKQNEEVVTKSQIEKLSKNESKKTENLEKFNCARKDFDHNDGGVAVDAKRAETSVAKESIQISKKKKEPKEKVTNTKSATVLEDGTEKIENLTQNQAPKSEDYKSVNYETVIGANDRKALLLDASNKENETSEKNQEFKIPDVSSKMVIHTNNSELFVNNCLIDTSGEKNEMLKEKPDSKENDSKHVSCETVTGRHEVATLTKTDGLSDSSRNVHEQLEEVLECKEKNQHEIVVDTKSTKSLNDIIMDAASEKQEKLFDKSESQKELENTEVLANADNPSEKRKEKLESRDKKSKSKSRKYLTKTDDLSGSSQNIHKSLEEAPECKEKKEKTFDKLESQKGDLENTEVVANTDNPSEKLKEKLEPKDKKSKSKNKKSLTKTDVLSDLSTKIHEQLEEAPECKEKNQDEIVVTTKTTKSLNDKLIDASSEKKEKSFDKLESQKRNLENTEVLANTDNPSEKLKEKLESKDKKSKSKSKKSLTKTDDLSDSSRNIHEQAPECNEKNQYEIVVDTKTTKVLNDNLMDASQKEEKLFDKFESQNGDLENTEVLTNTDNPSEKLKEKLESKDKQSKSKSKKSLTKTDDLSDLARNMQEHLAETPECKEKNRHEIVVDIKTKKSLNDNLMDASSVKEEALFDKLESLKGDSENTEVLANTDSPSEKVKEKLESKDKKSKSKSKKSLTKTADLSDSSRNIHEQLEEAPECKGKNQHEILVDTKTIKSLNDNLMDALSGKKENLFDKLESTKEELEHINCDIVMDTKNCEILANADNPNEILNEKLESKDKKSKSKSKKSEPSDQKMVIDTNSADSAINNDRNILSKKIEKAAKIESKKKDPKRIDFIIENLKNRKSQKIKEAAYPDQTEHVVANMSDSKAVRASKHTVKCDSSMEIYISPQAVSEKEYPTRSSEFFDISNEEAIDYTMAAVAENEHSEIIADYSEIIETETPKELNGFEQDNNINVEFKNSSYEQEAETDCQVKKTNEDIPQAMQEEVVENDSSQGTIIPSSVSEINDAVEDNCLIEKDDLITNAKEPEIVHNIISIDNTRHEILKATEFDKENVEKTINSHEVVEPENVRLDNQSVADKFEGCFTKNDNSVPELKLAGENNALQETTVESSSNNAHPLEQTSELKLNLIVDNSVTQNNTGVEEEIDENSQLLDIRPQNEMTDVEEEIHQNSQAPETHSMDVEEIHEAPEIQNSTDMEEEIDENSQSLDIRPQALETHDMDLEEETDENSQSLDIRPQSQETQNNTDVEEEIDENSKSWDIRPHATETAIVINDDSLIEIPNTESDTAFIDKLKVPSLSNDVLHFKDLTGKKHYNKNENCTNIIPINTTETITSKNNTIHDHSVPSTSGHSINSFTVPSVSQVVVDTSQVPTSVPAESEEVIVNLSTSNAEAATSCETTDNLIAVLFSNVALCNNTEVINNSERNRPNKTGFIFFQGTEHNYHSVGDPLLSGKYDNSESDHSSENSKETPNPKLENVLVDDNILPYIPTLTENNLNQELSSSLSESPVDSSTDFQLLEQCFIGNTLGRESSPPLPQGCDKLYQTNLKQEVLDYEDNSSSNMEFSEESSEVYINQFQQQTMSEEHMSELMNAVLTRIHNLNNMTRPTQRYDSNKENLLQPAELNVRAEAVQTKNTNSLTPNNLESDCNFVPMQETSNSHPESNVEYSNISFGNEVPEPVSFETDFTNFHYLPVAHDTSLNNSCNKKVIVERILQYPEQQLKSFTEINNVPSVSTLLTSTTSNRTTNVNVRPTSLAKQPEIARSFNKVPTATEITTTIKPNNLLIDKVKQTDSETVSTSTPMNVGFVRTSSRTRVSAPRPKKPSDFKSLDARDGEESGTETDRTFNSGTKSDDHVLKLKVRGDLGISNNSPVDTRQDHKIVPAKERSLCIIEDSNGLDANKQINNNRLCMEETSSSKLDVRKASNKQGKEKHTLNVEDLSKLNAKAQNKQLKEDVLTVDDLNKLNHRRHNNSNNNSAAHIVKKQTVERIKEKSLSVKDAKSQTIDIMTSSNVTVQNKTVDEHFGASLSDNVKRRKRKPVDYIERVDYSSIDKLLGCELLHENSKTPQRTRQKKEEPEDNSLRPKKRKQEIIEDRQVKSKTTSKVDAVSSCNLSDTEPDVIVKPKNSIFEDSDDDIPKKKKSNPESSLEPDSMNDLFDRLVKEGNVNTNVSKSGKDTTDPSPTVKESHKDDFQKFNKNVLDLPHTSSGRTISSSIFNLEPKKTDVITPVKQIGVVNPIPRSSNVVRKEPPCNRNSYGGSEEGRNSSQYYSYYSERTRRSYPYSNRESSRSSHQGSSRRMEYQPHSSDQRYSSQRSSSSGRSSRSSRHHSNSRSSTEQRNYDRYASSAATDLAWREDMKKKFPNMFKDEVYF